MAKKQTTVFDYISWRGDISLSELAPNEVDSLVFSLISYIDFDGIVPSPNENKGISLLAAVRRYLRRHKGENQKLGLIMPKESILLLARAAKSKRFGETRLTGYVNHICDGEQKQFSALTFRWRGADEREKAFVAFRGTDDTIIGWKENFNMSFMQPVPSQLEAVAYLEEISRITDADIYVGGHSKGGNLAVYGAVKCAPHIKERILYVYNFDGPGFDSDFVKGVDYLDMREKIHTIVPQSSVIGMLLEHEENYEVVKSYESGLLQHNGMSWEVMGGSFTHLESVTSESRLIDETLKSWLEEMTAEQRQEAIDSIYTSLTGSNAKTLTDLNTDKRSLVKAWSSMNNESRALVKKCITLLAKNSK